MMARKAEEARGAKFRERGDELQVGEAEVPPRPGTGAAGTLENILKGVWPYIQKGGDEAEHGVALMDQCKNMAISLHCHGRIVDRYERLRLETIGASYNSLGGIETVDQLKEWSEDKQAAALRRDILDGSLPIREWANADEAFGKIDAALRDMEDWPGWERRSRESFRGEQELIQKHLADLSKALVIKLMEGLKALSKALKGKREPFNTLLEAVEGAGEVFLKREDVSPRWRILDARLRLADASTEFDEAMDRRYRGTATGSWREAVRHSYDWARRLLGTSWESVESCGNYLDDVRQSIERDPPVTQEDRSRVEEEVAKEEAAAAAPSTTTVAEAKEALGGHLHTIADHFSRLYGGESPLTPSREASGRLAEDVSKFRREHPEAGETLMSQTDPERMTAQAARRFCGAARSDPEVEAGEWTPLGYQILPLAPLLSPEFPGLMLKYEAGTGKTLSALTCIAGLRLVQGKRRALVLCPGEPQ